MAAAKMGDRVRDVVTGFSGIAVAKVEYLNGCVRFGVQSGKLKNGVPGHFEYFDVQQLEVVKARAVAPVHQAAEGAPRRGGPMPAPRRAADPGRL